MSSDAARPGGLFDRLGTLAVRRPWVVIASWIGVAIAFALIFPPLMVAAARNPAPVLPVDAPTMVTAKEMGKAFPDGGGKGSQLLLILTDEKGLNDADFAAYGKLVEALHKEKITTQDFISTPPMRGVFESKDKKAWNLPVFFDTEVTDPATRAQYKQLTELVKETTAGTNLKASYAGAVASITDLQKIGEEDAQLIEIGTAASVLLILLMIYRNVIAMMVPLVTIGLSVATAQGLLSGLSLVGMDIQTQTIVFMTAVMIGAGTDYAVFLISRYHDYVRQGLDSDQAVKNALMSIGKVIAASAATVAVTFLVMVFSQLSLFASVGPAISVSIVVAFLAAVTLLPSILAIIGRRGWIKPRRDLTHRFWRITGTRVVRRPVIHLVGSLIVLATLASCTLLARFNYDDLRALPKSAPSVAGFAAMDAHFPPNMMTPMVLLVTSPRDLRAPSALADLEQMASRVAQLPNIVAIRGLTRPDGEPLQQTRVSYQAGEVGSKLDEGSKAINDHGSDLDRLADGSNQLAEALAAVRDQVNSAVGSAGSLVTMLTTAKALIGGDKTLNALDQTAKLVGRMRSLGESLDSNTTDARNIAAWATPLLAVLNTSPACDADPACISSRGQLQTLVQANSSGTLGSIQSLAKNLKQTSEFQTVAQSVAQLEQTLNQAVNILREIDGLQGKLNAMKQGAEALAAGSRGVADGVRILVDQTKKIGSGLGEASSFLLGVKHDADKPSMGGFNLPPQVLGSDEFKKGSAIFVSSDGHAARFFVQSGLNGFTTEAMDQTEQIVKAAKSATPNSELSDATIALAGIPSGLKDTRDYYNDDIYFIVFATIIIVFLILVILLRAIIAPLYLIGSVLISFLSAIGIGVAFFQLLLGMELHWSLPGLSFILLVAVGADYNMLLISRIRDESPHGVRVGVIRTVGSTGGVITSAGLIFAASMFGLLAASIATMLEAGFIIGTGILIDTFLVRTITVPALAAMIGQANWWPSKLGTRTTPRRRSLQRRKAPNRLLRIQGIRGLRSVRPAPPPSKVTAPPRKSTRKSILDGPIISNGNGIDPFEEFDSQPLPLFGSVVLPRQLTLRVAVTSADPNVANGKGQRPVAGRGGKARFASTGPPLLLTGLRTATVHSKTNGHSNGKGSSNGKHPVYHPLPLFGPVAAKTLEPAAVKRSAEATEEE